MTTRYVDRCQTKGCPQPNSEEWHHCFVCGKAEGDHQHFPKKSLAGKGAKIVSFLCRNHHEKITLHQWREGVYTHPDGSVRYYVQNQKGEKQCERIIEEAKDADREASEELRGEVVESGEAAQDGADETLPQDTQDHSGALHGVVGQPAAQCVRQGEPDLDAEGLGGIGLREPAPAPEINAIATSQIGATGEKALVGGVPPTDLTQYSDEQLATLFAWADKQQKDSFLTKCQVVHAYRERHVQAWGESWIDNAYDLLEGSPSRRTLEAYANIWAICDAKDAHFLEHIGPLTDSHSLMKFIGRKNPKDGQIALETAVAHLAKFGEAPTVPALTAMLGEESKPEMCPKTGLPHNWQRVCRDCGKGKP